MPTPKSCCGDGELLRRFINEELDDADEQRVSDHLGSCSACRQQIESWLGNAESWQSLRAGGWEWNQVDQPCEVECAVEPIVNSSSSIRHLLAPTDDPSKIGRLGKYEICGVIGRGSAGIVCKALDPSLNRLVAIKILVPGYASNVLVRRRFEREGRAIAAVRDANVIQVHGVDEFQGTPFIVMQYMPSGSLQKRLDAEGPLTAIEVCRIGLQIASGLEAAHRQGIIHRDIKPANVLIEDGLDRAIVSDFGLARVADEATMTHSGSIAGTPQFMSPEQAQGESLDFRSDLFSLGSVMYACCTGHSPFRAETLMGVIHQVRHVQPKEIQELNPEIPNWLAAFIGKLLSKNKENRFDSAGQVADLLSAELAFLQMPTKASQPKRTWQLFDRPVWWKRKNLAVCLVGILLVAFLAISLTSPAFLQWSEKRSSSSENAIGFEIEPTEQELNFFKAKAAYDLAYETHLSESALNGDMRQSIVRHQRAIELGYDKSQSNYFLARAYAFQNDEDLAIASLREAIRAGFHDLNSLRTEPDLNSVRQDERFREVVNQVAQLENLWADADRIYFRDHNYLEAVPRFRQWMETCPDDDLAVTLLGASLTELGNTRQAWDWNERARHTVRYAKFANYNQGCVALQQGRADEAIEWLRHAIETGFTDADHMEKDHLLQALRGDARFQALLVQLRQDRD